VAQNCKKFSKKLLLNIKWRLHGIFDRKLRGENLAKVAQTTSKIAKSGHTSIQRDQDV